MELDKCSCYLSIWDFQEDGYAYMVPPDKLDQQIIVYDLQKKPQQIKLLFYSETSQKLLGVMRNPIGNQQDEITRLKDKSNSIATRINLNAITSQQAKMAYESFYIPAMRTLFKKRQRPAFYLQRDSTDICHMRWCIAPKNYRAWD
jgi:hypothetical protein